MAALPSWVWDEGIPSLLRLLDKRRAFLAPVSVWADRRALPLVNFFGTFGALSALRVRALDLVLVGDVESEGVASQKSGLSPQVWLRVVNEETGQEATNLNAVGALCRASPILWPGAWLLQLRLVRFISEEYANFQVKRLEQSYVANRSQAARMAAAKRSRRDPLIRIRFLSILKSAPSFDTALPVALLIRACRLDGGVFHHLLPALERRQPRHI